MSEYAQTHTDSDTRSSTHLELKLTVLGSSSADSPEHEIRFADSDQRRRLEVILRPEMPTDVLEAHMRRDTPVVTRWAEKFIRRIVKDMKHSQDWWCEFCGECISF